MQSLRIIYDVDGWAFHNRALALQKYAPSDFKVTIAELGKDRDLQGVIGKSAKDVLFVLPQLNMQGLKEELRRRRWNTKVVRSSNQGWPYWVSVFFDSYCDSDILIVNNRDYWEKAGRLTGTTAISNGVDLEVFSVKSSLEIRKPKVLWVGSSMGRKRKGYDDLLVPLQNELEKLGIPSDFLLVDSWGNKKLTRNEMVDWYNEGTVYVCTSKAEGTPNPCLEAAACGCVIVSTAVGNMPELIRQGVNGYLVNRDLGSFVNGIQTACENYLSLAKQMQKDIKKWHWAKRSAEFFQLFRNVLNSDPEKASWDRSRIIAGPSNATSQSDPKPEGHSTDSSTITPRPLTSVKSLDHSDVVTVFVSTVGAPSHKACLTCLAQQDCKFRLNIIDHVAPMSQAFQKMLDDCSTTFFVQVDEDMLLYPHAIRTLYEVIANSSNCMFVANLYDVHLERCIQGIKIYRHVIVRNYPYEDVESCEKSQVRRLRADGHVIQTMPLEKSVCKSSDALGLHGIYWTSKMIYERYLTLERKRRTNPVEMKFFQEYHGVFLERYLDQPSKLNFFALMGVICGAMEQDGQPAGEKDYRNYQQLPGLLSIENLWNELSHTAPVLVSELFIEAIEPPAIM
ncbi:MAG: glycosyltransferase family 4 protein [Pirellulales bacterium]